MKRPYICTPVGDAMPNAKPRLVNAGTPAAARLHVTKPLYEVKPATAADVSKFYEQGGKIEEAAADGVTGTLPGVGAQS